MSIDFKVDTWSFIAGTGVGLVTLVFSYFGKLDGFVLKWLVRLCVQHPKTSSFKELKNKPLKRLKRPFFTDANDLEMTLQNINTDPNMKFAGVTKDISLIMKCLFMDKDELLVHTMDNIVISKQGVEILICTFEKKSSEESYDRSIFIDITYYRGIVLQWHGFFIIVCGLVGGLVASSGDVRSFVANHIN